jgi:hypothetical protein
MDDFNLDSMSEADILSFDYTKFDDVKEEPNADTQPEVAVEDVAVEDTVEDTSENSEATTENTEEGNTDEPSVNSDVEVDEFQLAMDKLKTDGIDFKGNKVKFNSAEELLSIVQKGLGSNKRMQELKPKLRILDMLDRHGLADESKLSLIIDAVAKKNPTAINKLVKDSGLDLLDLDGSLDYKANDYSVSDTEFDLQMLLDENKDSPKYLETINVIKNMDTKSKSLIGSQPERFLTILGDKESGVYDDIAQIVEGERMKGKYTNVGFLEAYEAVVNIIKENLPRNSGMGEGRHNNSNTSSVSSSKTVVTPNNNTSSATSNKKGSNVTETNRNTSSSLQQAKQAASGSLNSPTGKGGKVIDLTKLSAEEIMKLPITAFD